MRSAVEATGDQSIPPSSSHLRWSSPLPSSLTHSTGSQPIDSTLKMPSPMETQESQDALELQTEQGTSGMEAGPSSSPCDTAQKSPPRDLTDSSMCLAESARETPNDSFNEGEDLQPSTSKAHSDFVENNPMKLLKPKLEPLDEESSRDGFTPLDTLAHIKTESGLSRLSEMRSEDSRSEVSNVESKRYRVSFKVCSKAAARLKRILNAQPMALKKLGIAGVQVDPSGGMISVAARAKERAAEEATRRPEPAHTCPVPTPALPVQSQMRVGPDRNGDAGGMMVAGGISAAHPAQQAPPQCHPVMHPGHMGVTSGQMNIQHPQMGDGPSGSGVVPMGAMPPSALPPHMQQQRQSQPPPTNSPILVNLLNSQQPPPPVGGRPFSPYAPGYSGGPPGGSTGVPPSAQAQSSQTMEMAAYHHQMQERQRMMMQQQQQQQMQQQGVSTPTTPGSAPGPSGYGYPQRPMYPGPQPGMFPQGHPNAQQRVPYPGQPAMYPTMPQVKQEPVTTGYGAMPQVKQEPVETAPPPPKKRKKPTKKQQKEAEAQAAAAQAQAAAAQPGPYFSDGRMINQHQMQGAFPGGAPPHPPYPPGAAGPPPPGMSAQFYQQQQNQQMFMQQQGDDDRFNGSLLMQHQRMMQQQQQQQQQAQQHMGMAPEYPAGTHAAPPPGPSAPWIHSRPPPVPYPSGQNDTGAGASGVTGTGELGSQSDSNSPVTPFAGHHIIAQQQQSGHPSHPSPSPMYSRDSGGGTPTLFPYPSTSHGGPGPSGQSGVNSTPLTPGTTPQTPAGLQGQPTITNDHHDFDVKLLGEGSLDDLNLGDLDDIVPMGDLMMGGGEGGQTGGEGTVKEETLEENGEGGGGTSTTPIKKNGRHDLDMSINSVVDMVAKGGGELSSPTPPATATPTGGGNGGSAFPVTTPTPNTSSTAPPTPTQQTPPNPTVRRKNTSSSVQLLTTQQRMQQQQQMMGGGGVQYGTPFGMAPGGVAPQGGMMPMHTHPNVHSMGHGPPHGIHLPHQQTSAPAGNSMEHHSRSLPPSYHPPSRGGRAVGSVENGRVNGHAEMSNGIGSKDDTDPAMQALICKLKAQERAQVQAKEQKANTGAKGRGGGTGARKKRKPNEIAKERSPKEEEDSFLAGMDGLRGPSTMTAGQAAKARMGVTQGGGGGMGAATPSYYHHSMATQNVPMRPQPPPVQNKPA